MPNLILMMLGSLLRSLRTHAAMQAEILALRHQLIVLQRTQNKRLVLYPAGSVVLGLALTAVAWLAFRAYNRQPRNRSELAPSRLPLVLDVEGPSWPYRTSPCF
jgi:hypothetical protein